MARSKAYPRDVRERAVALVFEQVKTGQYGTQWEAIRSVAAKIGASGETVRKWVLQRRADAGASVQEAHTHISRRVQDRARRLVVEPRRMARKL